MGNEDQRTERAGHANPGTEAGAGWATTATGAEAGTGGRRPIHPAERSGAASVGSAAESTPEPERQRILSDILRGCERSTLYHKAREGALDSAHRFMMFLIVVGGSGAVIAVSEDLGVAPYIAVVPAILGAIDLVFGLTKQAKDHAVLARDFMDLAADARIGARKLDELQARFYRLCAEEPPVYEALESLCFNQIASAQRSKERRVVALPYRILRHIVRFSGKKFPTRTVEEPS
jgi:hypothetical protein